MKKLLTLVVATAALFSCTQGELTEFKSSDTPIIQSFHSHFDGENCASCHEPESTSKKETDTNQLTLPVFNEELFKTTEPNFY